MKAGTIIRVRQHQNANGDYEWIYHKLCNGYFQLITAQSAYNFKGLHFVCLGSTYFYNFKGSISGFELLNWEHEIVTEVPNDLKL
jgi:hypothetical protein